MAHEIEVENLQKVLDQTLVIDIEALVVKAGEIAAIVGPTGSGKDHLLGLLTGQSKPTVGTVRLAGINPLNKEAFSRHVGVLFTEDSLYQRQSPYSNLVFHGQLHGLDKSRVTGVLAQVGLADHANAKLDKLSPGLTRRLAFGRAILHQPTVLLLMEPFARCDEATVSLLSDLIRQEAENGTAVLVMADNSTYLTALCHKIYTLEQGRISGSYSPQEEQEAGLPLKIPARLEGKVALVNPTDVLYADAESSRAYLQTTEGRLPTQFTLGELEERLSRQGFFRAHRAYLVNLQHVKEIIRYTRNSFSLRLDDPQETEIPLSKSAASELRELLDY